MITVAVEIDGLLHKGDTLADQAGDLEDPLKKFGQYLKIRALERYRAQDFDKLADSTIAKRTQAGMRSVERKLVGDVDKAQKRAASRLGGVMGILAAETRGVRNRQAVLADFAARWGRSEKLIQRADLQPLTLKQQVSLGGRVDRAVAKAVGKPILGGLPKTLEVELGNGEVTLRSATYQHWSDAHNEGAVVGHGAALPKRETVKLEEQDMDVFVQLLREHMLLPLEGAA